MTKLTKKDRCILELVANGKSYDQVALEIGISQRAIHQHMMITRKKLGALSTAHAVGIAVRDGIVEVKDET